MRESLRDRRFPEHMLMLLILFSMFFPIFFSEAWTAYSPDFILVNVFAAMYILSVVYQRRAGLEKGKAFVPVLLGLLLCFNVCALYINRKYLHWYYGQINVSVSFLLFAALILSGADEGKSRNLDFLLKAMVISNAIGMIPYFLNYYGLEIMNGQLHLIPMEGQYDERRYSWFYCHKSEYSFMLLVFLALIVTYRKRFPRKWMYYGSVGVMILGVAIANTRTSMVAMLAIFTGLILDEIRRKPRQVRRRYMAVLAVLFVVMVGLLCVISRRRDLLSLGSRTYIWEESLKVIGAIPYGLGRECGVVTFPVPAWPWEVYNCHNFFLNILLQFSVPAGAFYILMLAVIIVVSLFKKPSFLTLGIWAALLIPLNMDWCLLLQQLSIFLVAVYFLFFYREEPQKAE